MLWTPPVTDPLARLTLADRLRPTGTGEAWKAPQECPARARIRKWGEVKVIKAWIKRPSPAMLVALVALFVSLGGSAYAVTQIGTNQIKNGAVTTPKIKSGAVRGDRLSVIKVEGETVVMGPGQSEIAAATCPRGRQAVGYTWDSSAGVTYYYSVLNPNEVLLYALAPAGGGPYEATATVVCV